MALMSNDDAANSELFENLAEQFTTSLRRGETPSIEEIAEQNPVLADRIRTLFPLLVLMENKGNGREQATSQLRAPENIERIGDFRIECEIGRGGMGIVYRAIQESLGRVVAMKLLPHGSLDPRLSERFQQEARLAAMLHHTNIVPIYGVGSDAGYSYLVMQYIEGTGLDRVLLELKKMREGQGDRPTSADSASVMAADWLAAPETSWISRGHAHAGRRQSSASTGRFSLGHGYWQNIARLGMQVADGLAHAHDIGILHRDIKPSNLLLDQAGAVWITDFGLARLAESSNLTRTGEVIGTLRYMPPEQLSGVSNEQGDIYSLGLTLYELATLQPAFSESDPRKLIAQVSEPRMTAPRKINPRIPRDLETIILKAVSFEPAKRYASATKMAVDLSRFLEGQPIQARRIGLTERLTKWTRRHPAIASLSAAVILITIAGIAGITWKWREAAANYQQLVVQSQMRDTYLKQALAAEKEAKTRATELDQVANFQAAQISAIDPLVMGQQLQKSIVEAAPENRRQALTEDLGKVNFTDIARTALNENVLKQSLAAIQQQFADQPVVKAHLLQTLADTALALGLIDFAVGPQQEALSLRRKELGDSDADTLKSLLATSWLYREQGDYEKAKTSLTQALSECRRYLGENDRTTLDAISDMGGLLRVLGKYDEAEPYYHQALDGYRAAFGNDDEGTIIAINNMAYILAAKGRLADAEVYFREAYEARRRIKGEKDPDTLRSMGALARDLRQQSKFAEAEPLYRKALEGLRIAKGNLHPDTLIAVNDLGVFLESQGRHSEALSYFQEAVDGNRLVYGDNHPNTLSALNNMGHVLRGQGKLQDAEPYLHQALVGEQAALGVGHPTTMTAELNYCGLLVDMKRYTDALEILTPGESRARKVWSQTHVNRLATYLQLLGDARAGIGDYTAAEPVMLEAVKLLQDKGEPADQAQTMDQIQDLIKFYESWHTADPTGGHDTQAHQWRSKLPSPERSPAGQN